MSLKGSSQDWCLRESSNNCQKSTFSDFWRHAFAIQGSITPHVIPNVLIVGALAGLVCLAAYLAKSFLHVHLGLAILPFEMIGGALGVVLIIRTNSGYERWWEARKLWGGIVNQSRNLAITALSYGPKDADWRDRFIRWVAVFPLVARSSLRCETPGKVELANLVGNESAERMLAANHMPSMVAYVLASLLREACEKHDMDRFAFMQADKERALLIDHIGACERILKTPLALAYSIKIRRFIAMFLLTLPFGLLDSLNYFLVPLVTMLVAYPLLSLDQLGVELQNPFDTRNLSHLPLDDISSTIKQNVLALLDRDSVPSTTSFAGMELLSK